MRGTITIERRAADHVASGDGLLLMPGTVDDGETDRA
jgi:hypothetical protein